MTLRVRGALATLAVVGLFACGPVDDQVFTPLAISPGSPLVVPEGAGVVEIPVRLTADHDHHVSASYRAVGLEAQNTCQVPDFEAAEGGIEWAPGELEARVRVWVGEDDLAETDERFALELEPGEGLPAAARARIEIVITDNDRTALVDAAARGVLPGSASDQAPALQAVLDDAATLGRSVVVMAPGDYEISSVRLPPGLTLSARGVTWRRPSASEPDIVSLRVEALGAEASPPTLVEGLSLDGRRDLQGAYRDHERENAHLVALHGDAERGGRIRATLERLALASGTGSGVKVGSDAEVTACELSASELWRDAVTVTGGATTVRLRGLDATATEGTGLWLGPREEGYERSLVMSAEVEDARVGAGDVEIETTSGSSVTLRSLIMTQPPFRLDALDGSVRITDSVLMLGLPSELHNHFGPPHDVEITRTTLVASEMSADGGMAEAPRTLAAVPITAEAVAPGDRAPGSGRLLFDGCHFERSSNLEADDVVYAVENAAPDLSVTIRASTLGSGFADWFAPGCSACVIEP